MLPLSSSGVTILLWPYLVSTCYLGFAHIITLRPSRFIDSLDLLSVSAVSSKISTLNTLLSAYNHWPLHLALNLPSLIKIVAWLSTDPWCILTMASNSSLSCPLSQCIQLKFGHLQSWKLAWDWLDVGKTFISSKVNLAQCPLFIVCSNQCFEEARCSLSFAWDVTVC